MQKSQKSSPTNDHAYSSYEQIESPISQSKTIQASFTFKETPDFVIQQENELKMPLVFFPQSSQKNIWTNIASDILRSIHSEYSFAKKSELKFEKKTKNVHIEKKMEKFTTEPSSYKSKLFHFYYFGIFFKNFYSHLSYHYRYFYKKINIK